MHAVIEIHCVDKRTMKGALGFHVMAEFPLNTPLMLIGSLDERTGNVSGSTDSPSFPERQTVPFHKTRARLVSVPGQHGEKAVENRCIILTVMAATLKETIKVTEISPNTFEAQPFGRNARMGNRSPIAWVSV